MKYVVFMCRTINISISKWPRMGGNIQPAITDREDSCFWLLSQWSRVGHTLRPLFMLWFVKIWQVSLCRKFVQHLETFYFDSWSWLSLMFCDVFNCLFPLDVQNVIQIDPIKSLLLFMPGLFIGFLVEKYVARQSRKSDFASFSFFTLLDNRVKKLKAILTLLDKFQKLHLES